MTDATPPEDCPPERLAEALKFVEEDSQAGLTVLQGLVGQYPDDARLHFLGGSVLAGLGRFDEARGALARAVRLAPTFEIARFQLGLLQLTSGDAEAAAVTWGPLQDLPEDHALRLFSDGLLEIARDAFGAAEAKLRLGIARNQENPALNRDMQMVLDAMAQRDQAGFESQEVSAAQLLLQQFAPKSTRH